MPREIDPLADAAEQGFYDAALEKRNQYPVGSPEHAAYEDGFEHGLGEPLARPVAGITYDDFNRAYDAGKSAYRHDYGMHGPTLHPVPRNRTPNPLTGLLAKAWQRGYAQDVNPYRP